MTLEVKVLGETPEERVSNYLLNANLRLSGANSNTMRSTVQRVNSVVLFYLQTH